ncbi:DUF6895 family protein [Planomonospora venezuelensis]|uniref:DUF6895 domain-containing protein n=1 Tax=Planomonospora venezuelensis TaxID=1999 RepID=A0A841D5C2_PLAVE|nr:hypothetical protein [Planomonospora venezuelensis]MBB5963355.1 hypothetical protein [Planomonospora venezuelensis]GIN05253.1 hypothetical protein Pve01_69110 [Planomonospora venezuelensis]
MTRELEDRLVAALRWGAVTIRAADPGRPPWRQDGTAVVQPFDKLLVEAALLALLARRAIGPHPAVTDLVGAITDCRESLDRTYEIVRWRPYLWTSAGAVWVFLDRLSAGDPVKRGLLRELWNAPVVEPRERVPYRLLDQAWTRMIARGRPDSRISSAGLRSTTSLWNLDGALLMSRNDLYAITHAAMYLTDFGNAGRVPAAPGWIGALAAARLLLGDFDLAGELAVTDVLTRGAPEAGTLAAAAALSTVFDRLGFVPAPTFRAQDHAAAEDPSAYLFFHSYHSTFVYGLLCAVLITSGAHGSALARLMTSGVPEPELPEEWHGGRAGVTGLGAQIVHTCESWEGIAAARGGEPDLLRTVVDAYLLDAASRQDTPGVLALLGMRDVAGSSVVDGAARRLLTVRARLGGASWTFA